MRNTTEVTKKKEATDAPATAPAETEAPKTYTFTEASGIMAVPSRQGKKAEAKTLLQKFGANRLSDRTNLSDPFQNLLQNAIKPRR